jgi:hypothetical protein
MYIKALSPIEVGGEEVEQKKGRLREVSRSEFHDCHSPRPAPETDSVAMNRDFS